MKTVKVLWPYESYDFGNGLVLNNLGVVLTDNEYDQVVDRIQALPLKSQPQIEVVASSSQPPFDLTLATRGWVNETLSSLGGGEGDGGLALAAHIDNPTPHPAYDQDMQDLTILFENGIT